MHSRDRKLSERAILALTPDDCARRLDTAAFDNEALIVKRLLPYVSQATLENTALQAAKVDSAESVAVIVNQKSLSQDVCEGLLNASLKRDAPFSAFVLRNKVTKDALTRQLEPYINSPLTCVALSSVIGSDLDDDYKRQTVATVDNNLLHDLDSALDFVGASDATKKQGRALYERIVQNRDERSSLPETMFAQVHPSPMYRLLRRLVKSPSVDTDYAGLRTSFVHGARDAVPLSRALHMSLLVSVVEELSDNPNSLLDKIAGVVGSAMIVRQNSPRHIIRRCMGLQAILDGQAIERVQSFKLGN